MVGFDDNPVAELLTPAQSIMHQDTDRAGELLVAKLIRQIQGQPIENVTLDTALIVRESCGATRSA